MKTRFFFFAMLAILASGVHAQIAKDDCIVIPKGLSGPGYIIDRKGNKIDGFIILHSSFGKEIWTDQIVISFCSQKQSDKVNAKLAKGKQKKCFAKDVYSTELQGYGLGGRIYVTKTIDLDGEKRHLMLEVLSEEEKTYKFYDFNDEPSDPDKYSIYQEQTNGELRRI